ncbi:MAG: hypothetical protein HKN73_04860, partial [Gemmatimonadetes bacterium]|nr:hypothetical protein [Gemmatimonadota bacterium]
SVDWASSPLTVIRSTWDYHLRRKRFLQWVRSVPTVENPPELVEWNTDKGYILGLSSSIPVIPSRLLDDPSDEDVEAALGVAGWPVAVLKPAVGLDGHGVEQVRRGTVPTGSRRGRWVLQPFVASVRETGEVSVVLIDGHPTHAVRRRPPANDFRAQERLGGSVERYDAPDAWINLARKVVAGLGRTPLYARVDLVEHEGAPTLMELELVEPSLFFEFGEEGLASMVQSIAARVGVEPRTT